MGVKFSLEFERFTANTPISWLSYPLEYIEKSNTNMKNEKDI